MKAKADSKPKIEREKVTVRREGESIILDLPSSTPFSQVVVLPPNMDKDDLFAFLVKPVPRKRKVRGVKPTPNDKPGKPYEHFEKASVDIPVRLVLKVKASGIARSHFDHAAMLVYVHSRLVKASNRRAWIPILHKEWQKALGLGARWVREAQLRLESQGLLLVERTRVKDVRCNRYGLPAEVIDLIETRNQFVHGRELIPKDELGETKRLSEAWDPFGDWDPDAGS